MNFNQINDHPVFIFEWIYVHMNWLTAVSAVASTVLFLLIHKCVVTTWCRKSYPYAHNISSAHPYIFKLKGSYNTLALSK